MSYKVERDRKKKTFNIAQYSAGVQKYKNEENVSVDLYLIKWRHYYCFYYLELWKIYAKYGQKFTLGNQLISR